MDGQLFVKALQAEAKQARQDILSVDILGSREYARGLVKGLERAIVVVKNLIAHYPRKERK